MRLEPQHAKYAPYMCVCKVQGSDCCTGLIAPFVSPCLLCVVVLAVTSHHHYAQQTATSTDHHRGSQDRFSDTFGRWTGWMNKSDFYQPNTSCGDSKWLSSLKNVFPRYIGGGYPFLFSVLLPVTKAPSIFPNLQQHRRRYRCLLSRTTLEAIYRSTVRPRMSHER